MAGKINYFTLLMSILGLSFNVFAVCRCFQNNNWQKLNNIKYLIVIQALASLVVISLTTALEFVKFLSTPFCVLLLATIPVYSLSFALLNIAVITVVKYAQLASKWKLRFAYALTIILTELLVSIAVEFPIIYYAIEGLSIVVYNGGAGQSPNGCANLQTPTKDPSLLFEINVVLYAFFYIFLHFAVLGTIIFNRLIMIAMHSWISKDVEDKKKQVEFVMGAQRMVNAFSVLLVAFIFLSSYCRLEDNERTLKSLNWSSQVMVSFEYALLCLPFYLLHEIDMANRSVSKLSSSAQSSLNEKPMLQRNEDDNLIIA